MRVIQAQADGVRAEPEATRLVECSATAPSSNVPDGHNRIEPRSCSRRACNSFARDGHQPMWRAMCCAHMLRATRTCTLRSTAAMSHSAAGTVEAAMPSAPLASHRAACMVVARTAAAAAAPPASACAAAGSTATHTAVATVTVRVGAGAAAGPTVLHAVAEHWTVKLAAISAGLRKPPPQVSAPAGIHTRRHHRHRCLLPRQFAGGVVAIDSPTR